MSWNRNAETQRRLKRRYRNPIYFDEDKNRWMHYELRGPKYRAFCKQLANRRTRHSNEYFQAKGKYKRVFNFWNELI